MKFTRRSPTRQDLTIFVKSLWKLHIEPGDIPFSQLYFPYGSFELTQYVEGRGIMQYVGSEKHFAQPELCYSGQFTKPFFLRFHAPCVCFGVSFKPWAGNILFNVPGNEFTDEMVQLSDLKEEALNLHDCTTDDEVFSALERFLVKKTQRSQLDETSAYLARKLMISPTRLTANDEIANICLSRRRVEQKFLVATGLSIGSYSRKIRFQKAVNLLSNFANKQSLTDLGLTAGYYDQSHFISEFKEFTSITPSTYLKQKNDLQKFLASLSDDLSPIRA